jgi:hypothetical protein
MMGATLSWVQSLTLSDNVFRLFDISWTSTFFPGTFGFMYGNTSLQPIVAFPYKFVRGFLRSLISVETAQQRCHVEPPEVRQRCLDHVALRLGRDESLPLQPHI